MVTGLLLIFAPELMLRLMRVPAPDDPVFLQFVGCFVAAVGLTYFIGLISWFYSGRIARLQAAWEMTIPFRLAAAIFVLTQIASHKLAAPWSSVPLVDGAWCLVQAALLYCGIFTTSSHGSSAR
ncbi:MAG: hypothetical protein P4L99_24340 [Chthoniobacter sp.]|nr:hypothetical protein [Chthoniobacter sp.]